MKASADKVAASKAAIAASGIAHLTAQAPGLYLSNSFLIASFLTFIVIAIIFLMHNAVAIYRIAPIICEHIFN